MSIFDASMQRMGKLPIFLDNDSEMQVGLVVINPEYVRDFDACPPMTTHKEKCPEHGQHVTHYSIPSRPRNEVKKTITIGSK